MILHLSEVKTTNISFFKAVLSLFHSSLYQNLFFFFFTFSELEANKVSFFL